MINMLRNSSWSKFCLFILLANFINLSANFYEGNILVSTKINMEDPIDTLTELIFEWALDGNDDLFPDNGTEQDDNSIKKIKLVLIEFIGFELSPNLDYINTTGFFISRDEITGYFSSDSPPPDYC